MLILSLPFSHYIFTTFITSVVSFHLPQCLVKSNHFSCHWVLFPIHCRWDNGVGARATEIGMYIVHDVLFKRPRMTPAAIIRAETAMAICLLTDKVQTRRHKTFHKCLMLFHVHLHVQHSAVVSCVHSPVFAAIMTTMTAYGETASEAIASIAQQRRSVAKEIDHKWRLLFYPTLERTTCF